MASETKHIYLFYQGSMFDMHTDEWIKECPEYLAMNLQYIFSYNTRIQHATPYAYRLFLKPGFGTGWADFTEVNICS